MSAPLDINALFEAVREVNRLADVARADGWALDFGGAPMADYLSVEAKKLQRGNGPE